MDTIVSTVCRMVIKKGILLICGIICFLLSIQLASSIYYQFNSSRIKIAIRNNTGEIRNRTLPQIIVTKSPLPELCAAQPQTLVGMRAVDINPVNITEVETLHPEVLMGGIWRPVNCTARHRVAIVIPYRNRSQQTGIFLRHMHPFLQRQQLEYKFFLIEQSGRSKFNRGMLFNIGFKEVEKMASGYFGCYVMTDIDLLPENDMGQYSCTYDMPRHLAVYLRNWGYSVLYEERTGGALEICPEHYQKVNGFSNIYFGWGGEDDDFHDRLTTLFPQRKSQQPFLRYNKTLAKFLMLKHRRTEKANPKRFTFLRNAIRYMPIDGLTSLNDTYKLLDTQEHKLFTRLLVEIDETKTMSNYNKRAKILMKEKTKI